VRRAVAVVLAAVPCTSCPIETERFADNSSGLIRSCSESQECLSNGHFMHVKTSSSGMLSPLLTAL
jgi:hypothetical protein